MKLLTFIPIWKRLEITRLCFEGLKRTYKEAPKGFEFQTVIAASNEADAALAESYGFDVVMCENKPLGRKFNKGLEYALEAYNWDYLFQLNSDDLLSTDFWGMFQDFFSKKLFFFGVDKVYFYDSESRSIREFTYAMGCGIRFIRRDIVEKAGYIEKENGMRFELWDNHLNGGLDHNSTDNILSRAKMMPHFARSKVAQRPSVIDIKSETNIHPFSEFKLAQGVNAAHRRQIMRRFPELGFFERRILKQVV